MQPNGAKPDISPKIPTSFQEAGARQKRQHRKLRVQGFGVWGWGLGFRV